MKKGHKRQRTLYTNKRFNTAKNKKVINIYIPNETIKIYDTKIDRIKGRNSSITIAGDFDIPLSITHRRTRPKIRKQRT